MREEAASAVQKKTRAAKPQRFKVLLHNDEYTTMEFVVEILTRHFHKAPAEATQVMLEVHYKGVGVAGVYAREIAETKVAVVTADARTQGMPLLLTLEAE